MLRHFINAFTKVRIIWYCSSNHMVFVYIKKYLKMRQIKLILLIVKIYFSFVANYVRVAEMNSAIKELIKRRANIFKVLMSYQKAQIYICGYVQTELLANERSCARQVGRGSSFWEVECQCRDDDFFKQNFRMSRSAFKKLCSELSNLQRKKSNFGNTICLEKRVAIALYSLGSSSEYRSIANLFGVGRSTVCAVLLEFCKEVWQVLQPNYLNHLPLSRETIEECVHGFKQIGFPQCLGAIDGCHIEIHPKQEEAVDYMNYKGWYSTVLLALVDARYRFLYINVGSPGRCNDSQIFERSNLKRELESCLHLSSMTTKLGNHDVPIVILGDSAFRFSKYLMKPYPFSLEKTSPQKAFNYHHARSRRVVENAFGQYKARFRRIGKGIDNRIENASSIIKACCVLHNFLIAENDLVSPSWLTENNTTDQGRRQPQSTNVRQNEGDAEEIRNALSIYFNVLDDVADGSGDTGDGTVGALEDVPDGTGDTDDGSGDEGGDNWCEDSEGGELEGSSRTESEYLDTD